MTKKIHLVILISLIIFFCLPALLSAAGPDITGLLKEAAGDDGAGFDTSDELAQTGIALIVGTVGRVFISLLGVLFISYTIYGGFLWLTSGGNEEKIEKAKKIISNGVIGLFIVLAAATIYFLVKEALTTATITDNPVGAG